MYGSRKIGFDSIHLMQINARKFRDRSDSEALSVNYLMERVWIAEYNISL